MGGTVYPSLLGQRPQADALCIAADGGIRNCRLCGVTPQLLVGDFDSAADLPQDVECLRYPPRKNNTDGQLAAEEAVRCGATEVIIIGGLDGRLDHTLSCLAIAEQLAQSGIACTIENGQNRVRFLENGTLTVPKSDYRYFGVVTLDRQARGVTLTGCRYPLHEAIISRLEQYAVSNEVAGDAARVTVRDGAVFVIESRDLHG